MMGKPPDSSLSRDALETEVWQLKQELAKEQALFCRRKTERGALMKGAGAVLTARKLRAFFMPPGHVVLTNVLFVPPCSGGEDPGPGQNPAGTDPGYWRQIEVHIQNHSDAVFSHGMCDRCPAA